MAALKREATAPGPTSELFDRLHELHLNAGEPGVRQIAAGIGQPSISYTTVHNVFRGPRVPKWEHLQRIVRHLGGDVAMFHRLWRDARASELALRSPGAEPGALPPPRLRFDGSGVLPAGPALSGGAPTAVARDSCYDFVLVVHRLPEFAAGTTFGGTRPHDFGEVVTALWDLVVARQGAWVGWPAGTGRRRTSPEPGGALYPIEMTDREIEEHYEGYCNSTIWPLYHNVIEQPVYRRAWRDTNRMVNQRFAEAVAEIAAPGALVWIHDYQLQLVPAMLRRLRDDLKIAFFLHIPFPPVETFLQLPGRSETLRGLLGADLVGFQQPLAAQNFLRLTGQLLALQPAEDSVAVDGRTVTVRAFPISVDFAAIQRLAADPRVRHRAAQIRADLGQPNTLLLGVDRLDYTKGIEQRLKVYGELLGEGLLSRDTSAFVQVARVSRERAARYGELRERVERLVGHLNGTHGRVGRPVVHCIEREFDFREVVALYLAADVLVVSPFRDGMNLTAKEYVAARVDNRGALVLSEFAGAAAELRQALLVNPFDLDSLKDAVRYAARMDGAEQSQRMRAMRRHLARHDLAAWVSSYLATVAGLPSPPGASRTGQR